MLRNKTLVALVDADDCIYNKIYRLLYYYLIANYGDFFLRCARKTQLDQEDEAVLNEIFEKLNELVSYHEGEVDVTLHPDLNFQTLVGKILENHGFSTNDVHEGRLELDKFLVTTLKKYKEAMAKLGDQGKNIFEIVLYLANKPFFHTICNKIKSEGFTEFYLMSGSSRQSEKLDELNFSLYGSGLFLKNDLKIIQNIFNFLLKENVSDMCKLDTFTMAKIFDGKDCVFDKTKFTLHYVVQNRFSRLNQNGETTVVFFDDKKKIHDALIKLMLQNLDITHKSVVTEYWHYDGIFHSDDKTAKPIAVLQGKSEQIDFNYKNNAKELVRKCGHDAKDFTHSIDAANQLSQEHLQEFKQKRSLSKQSIKQLTETFGTFNVAIEETVPTKEIRTLQLNN